MRLADSCDNGRRGIVQSVLATPKSDRIEVTLLATGEAELEGAEPIAIVGIGCRFPGGAAGPQAFWEMLCAGVDATTTQQFYSGLVATLCIAPFALGGWTWPSDAAGWFAFEAPVGVDLLVTASASGFVAQSQVVPAFSGALTITTTVHAIDQAVPVAFGFHPYLTLPGAHRDDWRVSLSLEPTENLSRAWAGQVTEKFTGAPTSGPQASATVAVMATCSSVWGRPGALATISTPTLAEGRTC